VRVDPRPPPAINVEGANGMNKWLFHSGDDKRRHRAGVGRASAPATRRSRFDPLEDRRMLAVDLRTLHSFDNPPAGGGFPEAGLTLVGSTLFGITNKGGADGDGTVFSRNPDGSDYQVLNSGDLLGQHGWKRIPDAAFVCECGRLLARGRR
jgi:uncharacterized repeat protein (TIGR03803 family)